MTLSPALPKIRPAWLRDQAVNDLAIGLEGGERSLLILAHEPAVADHIGRKDGSNSALNAIHEPLPRAVGQTIRTLEHPVKGKRKRAEVSALVKLRTGRAVRPCPLVVRLRTCGWNLDRMRVVPVPTGELRNHAV